MADHPSTTGYVNSDLSTNIYVLGRMAAQLPPDLAQPFRDQIQKLQDALLKFLADVMQRDRVIKELVEQQKLNTAYLHFDLEATKRERDALLRRLEDHDNA